MVRGGAGLSKSSEEAAATVGWAMDGKIKHSVGVSVDQCDIKSQSQSKYEHGFGNDFQAYQAHTMLSVRPFPPAALLTALHTFSSHPCCRLLSTLHTGRGWSFSSVAQASRLTTMTLHSSRVTTLYDERKRASNE